MGEFVDISGCSSLREGQMRVIYVMGREILLARVRDRIYAVDNVCPHMRGRLSHGLLIGTILVCPKHGTQFDLSDGRVLCWTEWKGIKRTLGKIISFPRSLTTYNVISEGGKVLVEV